IYDGDWSCQTGDGLECLKKTSIPRGNYIESICVVRTSGGDICTTGRVDITFTRPDTNAQLVFFNDGGELFNPANIMGAKITLKSPGGLTKMIVIYETGQISVQ
ncbi:MAG: hypothetical protein Q8P21_00245, partial [bacterium]|nr:hypothetical protein [bacterium]